MAKRMESSDLSRESGYDTRGMPLHSVEVEAESMQPHQQSPSSEPTLQEGKRVSHCSCMIVNDCTYQACDDARSCGSLRALFSDY